MSKFHVGAVRRALETTLPRPVSFALKNLRNRYNRALSSGDRYYCIICDTTYGRLLPGGVYSEAFERFDVVGGGFRERALCPGCRSIERERLLATYLLRFDGARVLTESASTLHFAPEAHLSQLLRRLSGQYLTADLFDRNVDRKIDVTDIPIEENSFDLVLCNHVLEHVPDDRRAMSELLRVTKPGGLCLLQVPIAPDMQETYEDDTILGEEDREREFGQFDHVRVYGADYVDRLKAVGFEVDEWLPPGDIIDSAGLNEREKLFVCTKPVDRARDDSGVL